MRTQGGQWIAQGGRWRPNAPLTIPTGLIGSHALDAVGQAVPGVPA